MPSPRLRSKVRASEPFSIVQVYLHRTMGDLDDYWRDHRDQWIAWDHKHHGPDSMPDPFWRLEARTLVADDPAEPIDWRDYASDELVEHVRLGHVSARGAEGLARAERLARRRASWLATNPSAAPDACERRMRQH